MEQIFAKPGFKHIADQIISYLDPSSMVNFKQVNQTIANYFKLRLWEQVCPDEVDDIDIDLRPSPLTLKTDW